jgi:hypothetical protein
MSGSTFIGAFLYLGLAVFSSILGSLCFLYLGMAVLSFILGWLCYICIAMAVLVRPCYQSSCALSQQNPKTRTVSPPILPLTRCHCHISVNTATHALPLPPFDAPRFAASTATPATPPFRHYHPPLPLFATAILFCHAPLPLCHPHHISADTATHALPLVPFDAPRSAASTATPATMPFRHCHAPLPLLSPHTPHRISVNTATHALPRVSFDAPRFAASTATHATPPFRHCHPPLPLFATAILFCHAPLPLCHPHHISADTATHALPLVPFDAPRFAASTATPATPPFRHCHPPLPFFSTATATVLQGRRVPHDRAGRPRADPRRLRARGRRRRVRRVCRRGRGRAVPAAAVGGRVGKVIPVPLESSRHGLSNDTKISCVG